MIAVEMRHLVKDYLHLKTIMLSLCIMELAQFPYLMELIVICCHYQFCSEITEKLGHYYHITRMNIVIFQLGAQLTKDLLCYISVMQFTDDGFDARIKVHPEEVDP